MHGYIYTYVIKYIHTNLHICNVFTYTHHVYMYTCIHLLAQSKYYIGLYIDLHMYALATNMMTLDKCAVLM